MTLLNDEDFELTPQNNLSEMGRFFIHFTADTFSIDEEASTNILSVFKADQNNFITIEGLALQSGETSVKLYNVIGMEVLSRNLNNNSNTQTISTNGLASGVYIIQLKSGINQLTKKLIIK
jgi:low affinity Fe/Cu permease